MPKLFDYCLLIEIPDGSPPNLFAMYPKCHTMHDELLQISASCVPYTENSKQSSIFAFNTSNYFCYCLYFCYGSNGYTVVILSSFPFAKIFESFYRDIIKKMEGPPTEPSLYFSFVTSFLDSWEKNVLPTVDLNFPSDTFTFTYNSRQLCFTEYEPSLFFSPEECEELWDALITGSPILLISPDAPTASAHCFALFSLLCPLQFKDPFAIWLRETDPRFADIINNCSTLKVVSTSVEELGRTANKFQLRINLKNRKIKPCGNLRARFERKMDSLIAILQAELDRMLHNDPYSDFLEAPISKNRLSESIVGAVGTDRPVLEQILKFQNTETFKSWRRKIATRNNLREAILSLEPKSIFLKRSPEELAKINEALGRLMSKFKDDLHVSAVLREHLAILSRMMPNQDQISPSI